MGGFMKSFLKSSAVFFVLSALLIFVSASPPCFAADHEGQTAAEAVNAFAVDLYGELRKTEGNLFFSPYSISLCLAMAFNGSRGATESQMATVLHFGPDKAKVNAAFRSVSAEIMAAAGKDIEINIANALWAEKSFVLLKEFLKTIQASQIPPAKPEA
jgi:serine protease inhibitor